MPMVLALLFPFLFPLGTVTLITRTPWATYGLVGANVLVWLVMLCSPDSWLTALALQPNGPAYQYITYGFTHAGNFGGLLHMALNLWFLYIFAVALEQKVGPLRLIMFYLVSVLAGGIAHEFFLDRLGLGLVGASAGVYGIIGAFMILNPFTQVRCLFTLLVVVFPIRIQMTQIAGIFFLPCYWILEALVSWGGLVFGSVSISVGAALIAHLGGLGAGAGLAAALYGFYAFSLKAEDDRQKELRLQTQLARKLADAGVGGPGKPTGSSLTAYRQVEPTDARLAPLQRALISGDRATAVATFRRFHEAGVDVCLSPGPQMDLVRCLIAENQPALAVVALERLLAEYHSEPIADIARLELARQLFVLRREPSRAAALLREFLAHDPPLDAEREASAMLQTIEASMPPGAPMPPPAVSAVVPLPDLGFQVDFDVPSAEPAAGSGSPVPAAAPAGGTTALFEVPVLSLNASFAGDPIGQESTGGLMRKADALFGSPDDTGANQPRLEGEPAHLAPAPKLQPDPSDSDFSVRIDDSRVTLQSRSGTPLRDISLPREQQPDLVNAPGFVPQETPVFTAPAGKRRRASDAAAAPHKPQLAKPAAPPPPSAPDDSSLPVLGELGMAPQSPFDSSIHLPPSDQECPTPEALEYGTSTSWEDQPNRTSQPDRATLAAQFQFKASGRYSVVLAPERPIELPIVVAVLAPLLNMPPEAAHHAVLRRRGLLAEGLGAAAARDMAEQLARHGQAVTVCDEGALPDFPPVEDLFAVIEQAGGARFQTTEDLHAVNWSDIWLIGAGQVMLRPGTPPRTVVDFIIGRPGLHLRAWENLFRFPKQVEQTIGTQFHHRMEQVSSHATTALRTRTFAHWALGEAKRPPHRFNSLIEYDNFLRWHLLAFFTPQCTYQR